MTRTIITVALVLSMMAHATAGYEEAQEAYKKGDYQSALEQFKTLADHGHAESQFRLAEMYGETFRTGILINVPYDAQKAAYWYSKAAVQGYAPAQHKLGGWYSVGLGGLPENPVQACSWYRRAAEQGYAPAQSDLAVCYTTGRGAPKDDSQATYWVGKAAEQGDKLAQISLGLRYEQGLGVARDYVDAYKWYNLAAAQGDSFGVEYRDKVSALMTPSQIAEGQRRTREWRPTSKDIRSDGAPGAKVVRRPHVTPAGSGFFVTRAGHVVTNNHVINGCTAPVVWIPGRNWEMAHVLATDPKNDLGLLKVELVLDVAAVFRISATRQGEQVLVYGFPLAGALASSGSATTGSISALAGIADDSRFFQISAPVQPGNSGGPLLVESGQVVGIVVSKLNALAVAAATGDIPQNVNFAIKGSVVKSFLESYGVDYEGGASGRAKSFSDLADIARPITVRVGCADTE